MSEAQPLCPRPPAMLHSPLKTALAYECFQDQASSTLALPSDHKLKTKGTGKQRVQEQVMMTVKRQKQKSSVSSSVGHSNRGKVAQPGDPLGTGLVLCGGLVGFGRGTDRLASLLGHLRQAVPISPELDGRV